MKLSFAIFALATAQDNDDGSGIQDEVWYGEEGQSYSTNGLNPRSLGSDSEKRYDDLESMALKLFAKNGLKGRNKFDERKYWAYGCHCFILGDRPMTEMGYGRPVDALDNKCKAYKDCQKCVRERHGDTCIGEMVRYTWKWSNRQNGLVSREAAGTCKRELFECDAQFVKDTYEQREVFNEDYHAFWSTTGFDREEKDTYCPSNGGDPVEHTCCGGHDGPWYWIGLNSNQCCAQGQGGYVVGANDQC